MDTVELFQRLSVALAIGLLIGIERGWQERDDPEGERSAGLRTLALAGLLGGVWGAIAATFANAGALTLGLAFAAFSAVVALFRYRECIHDQTFGATTVIAAMLAFSLGAFAVLGNTLAAAAAGVAAAGLLSLKAVLHAWVKRLTWRELRAGLLLLAMTFILLPILPNRTVDPWQALNPYEIWLMTVLIAIVSFAGYIAIRVTDERRGILIAGVAGGLVASTAVTLTMARLARKHPEQEALLTSGAIISSATMMVRVLVVVSIFNSDMFVPLLIPLGAAAASLAGMAAYFMHGSTDQLENRQLKLKNPFELQTVLHFGGLLTLVMLLAKAATMFAGNTGVYTLAAISGVADVDAITLSMARLGRGEIDIAVAVLAILIAVCVNMLSKSVLGWVSGGRGPGLRLAMAATVSLTTAVLGYIAGSSIPAI